MLSGIVLVLIWVFILAFAASESALVFASKARLDIALKGSSRRDRFFRYFERAPAARPFCIILRILAFVLMFYFIIAGGKSHSAVFIHWASPAAAAIVAELAGRYAGKRWATNVLLVFLPVLQIPGYLAGYLPWNRSSSVTKTTTRDDADLTVVDAAIEEIRVAVKDAASEGAIHGDEKDMIEGVLKFEDVEVNEIMTPRTDMECIDLEGGEGTILEKLALFHHTRIPVFEGVRDKIVGILHVKDMTPLLAGGGRADFHNVRELIQKPFFVPETKRAMSLLRDFKQRHLQIAVILDEYGGVSGLVTMEDIMEQIVGELEEGFEAERIEDRIKVQSAGMLDVDARLHISEINELLHVDLPDDEDYDTIGGFLLSQFGSVPEKGARLEYGGVAFQVLDSNERKVNRLLLKKHDGLKPGEPGRGESSV